MSEEEEAFDDAMANPAPPPQPAGEEPDDWALWEALDQTKKLPTRFANRIFISPDGQHLRISFGEQIKDDAVYHTALIVPGGEALEMGRLLLRMAQANVDFQVAHLRQLADMLEREGANPPEAPNG